jgi:DNA-binding FadR family transcriptional regulator
MLNPIAVRNLHGQVVQELGRQIVGGTLRPGDVLPARHCSPNA